VQRFAAPLLLAASILPASGASIRSSPPFQNASASPMTDQIAAVVRSFKGRMGVAAIDLRTGETLVVNADERFPTASTIKTAVMIETWQRVADGRLTMETVVPLRAADKVGGAGILGGMHEGLGVTIADLVHLMIVLSDNTATNMLIERLGTSTINARLDAYGLHETRLFRPTFRDGKADVLPELERQYGLGMTTPREMAKLMATIAEGRAVDRTSSDGMLATLRRQQDRAMIPRNLPSSEGLQIGNKTGTDEEKRAGPDGVKRHIRADAAIVTGPGLTYVLAIYAREIADTRWTPDNDALVTGARISRMVFDHFSRHAAGR
jgi:beta-lactamase class A